MKKIKGSILLISLVLVLVMTISGVTVLLMSNGEEKILGSYRQKLLTFKAAETALMQVEDLLKDLKIEDFSDACTSGLCFLGNDRDSISNCSVPETQPWSDKVLWETVGKHGVFMVNSGGKELRARYLIEFRCYVSHVDEEGVADVSRIRDSASVYRITVLQEDMVSVARTMLQSTYRISTSRSNVYIYDVL